MAKTDNRDDKENNGRMENVFLNRNAEMAVVDLLSDIFDPIAIMDPATVHHNLVLGCNGGMSEKDRSIPIELGNYLLSNFSWIYVGLIVDTDFRDNFTEAVTVEIALDKKDDDYVKQTRSKMRDDRPQDTEGNYVIDFSRYNDEINREVNGKLAESFELLDAYKDDINKFIEGLTGEEGANIGFVVSNFMFLIRAFAQNDLFTNYVKSICDSVKQQFLGDAE